MGDYSYDVHEFLVNHENELSSAAKQIPALRDEIADLPKTAATFRVTQFDSVNANLIEAIHVEFVKAWEVHDNYSKSEQNAMLFVNPNYAHAETYTDVLVDCQCGAVINRNNDRGEVQIQGEHNHTDECLPQYRLRARAKAHELKRKRMLRLARLGWRGNEMSSRLGATRDHIADLAREYHLSLESLRDTYRHIAGNTYAHLVREHGETGSEVAEVYGHKRETLSKWATKYADFEPSRELVRNENGKFEWQTPSTQIPKFINTDD